MEIKLKSFAAMKTCIKGTWVNYPDKANPCPVFLNVNCISEAIETPMADGEIVTTLIMANGNEYLVTESPVDVLEALKGDEELYP